MTCVIGLVDRSKIFMAADSALSGGQAIINLGEGGTKIGIRLIGGLTCIIGAAGSGRMGQLVLYGPDNFTPPEAELTTIDATMRWLVNNVCGGIRALLKTEGIPGKEGRTDLLPGSLLLGVRQRLFVITS